MPDGAPLPGWPRVLEEDLAAAYVGLGVSTFRREVAAGRAPAALRLTKGRIGWDVRALDRWVDQLAGSAAGSPRNPWDELLTDGDRAP